MAGMHDVAYAVCIEAKTFLRLQKSSCCCACCANRDQLADKAFDFTLVCRAASHSGHMWWNPKFILESMHEINFFQTLVVL